MDAIGDGVYATFRFNQIDQFSQVQLPRDDIQSNCTICIGNFNKDEIVLILPCVHKFHRSCIRTWLSKNDTCPTCRRIVIRNVVDESGDEFGEDESVDATDFTDNSDDSSSEIATPVSTNAFNSFFDPSTYESNSSDEHNSDISDLTWISSSDEAVAGGAIEPLSSSSDTSRHYDDSDNAIVLSNSSDDSIVGDVTDPHRSSSDTRHYGSNESLLSNSTWNEDMSVRNSDSSSAFSDYPNGSDETSEMLSDDSSD